MTLIDTFAYIEKSTQTFAQSEDKHPVSILERAWGDINRVKKSNTHREREGEREIVMEHLFQIIIFQCNLIKKETTKEIMITKYTGRDLTLKYLLDSRLRETSKSQCFNVTLRVCFVTCQYTYIHISWKYLWIGVKIWVRSSYSSHLYNKQTDRHIVLIHFVRYIFLFFRLQVVITY